MSDNSYRKVLDSIANVIELDGVLGDRYLTLPRLVRERLAEKRLPEPDATNPDHLRWASDIVDQVAPNDVISTWFRSLADRLERIEQAAQVMSENADRGVASMAWESMPDSIREQWRRNARALDAAGLLWGGGRGE